MNGYIALHRGRRWECRANTTFEAQKLAAAHWKVRRAYEITVMLAEKDGRPYVHTAVD